MTEHKQTRLLFLAIALYAACLAPALAQVAVPFDAVYEIRVDGKPRLESRIVLRREGDDWTMSSESKGTKGLARFLNLHSEEHSRGQWRGGQPRTSSFSHHSSVAGVDDRWDASFDWAGQSVATRTEDGDFTLEIAVGTEDPLSLTLALGQALAAGETAITVQVVDEDTIDSHLYRRGDTTFLQTALGCLEVVPLERIRENSSRYSTGWYATELNYVPVRLLHGKRDGKEFEMRVRSLDIDGTPVPVREDCSG